MKPTKKFLFVYFLTALFLRPSMSGSELVKKITSFSIPKFSSSRPIDYVIKGMGGLISLVSLWILKSYILSRYRRSKIKLLKNEFCWVSRNHDTENYPEGIPSILLKARENLFFGFKDLLYEFQKEMDIKDQNFVDYLITEAEGENYLQTNWGRERVVDKKIPLRILKFIDKSLKQVDIELTNVDVYSRELKENEGFYEPAGTSSWFLPISKKRCHEDLYIASKKLDRYENLFNHFALVLKERNALRSDIQKEEQLGKFSSTLLKFLQMEYSTYSNTLHEIGHILSHHNFINEFTVFQFKNISEDFKTEFRRYEEYMADALLPLVYKEAAHTQLVSTIVKTFTIDEKGKIIIPLFDENTHDSFYMSSKSNFVLYADIAKLHGISLKNCLPKHFQEHKLVPKSEWTGICNHLENIYNSADPEFYTQTYKNEDGTEETFKFPRFLPHLLEKEDYKIQTL